MKSQRVRRDWATEQQQRAKQDVSQLLKIRFILKVLKTELPYDPAIPLLSIYSRQTKTLIWKDICTPMFIIELFTIAKIWKQTKCPSTDEWIEKMWYTHKHTHTHTHTMEYYSAMKKNENFPFATIKMDLDFSKWNVRQRKKNTVWYHLYVESKK